MKTVICDTCHGRSWLVACPAGALPGRRHRESCTSYLLDPQLSAAALEYAAMRLAELLRRNGGRSDAASR